MRQPPISLVNLSDEEKERYAEASQRKMVKGITMYLIPFVLFGFITAYVNIYSEKVGLYDHPDLREWLNLALVIITILPARLFVNVILRNRKAGNAWQKKLIRGKIMAKDGKSILVAGEKIKLSPEELAKWNVNDYVIISASTTLDFVFAVEKGSEEN
jgi:hypothetical protein